MTHAAGTVTFKGWLTKQKKRHDPVGDFARDVAADPSFPDLVTKSGNALHFEWMPDFVREMFEEAWDEYAQEVGVTK
ncbi:MAG: YozE family protein [Thermoleophilaceae bacterium]